MERNKGKVITIYSTKGGVGKTVMTVNLASSFCNMGLKTLIIDLDLFSGGIATYLNSSYEKNIFNLVEDLTNNKYKNIEDYIFCYNDNIHAIGAPKDPRDARKVEAKYLPLILRNVIYKYDIVLIDTTHSYDDINITALDNSDTILYVFTNDILDIKNTKSFMSILKDLGVDNCLTVINDAVNLKKSYYSNYDIRNIIKHNVDFLISKSNYSRNIEKMISDSKISFMDLTNIAKKLTFDGKEQK